MYNPTLIFGASTQIAIGICCEASSQSSCFTLQETLQINTYEKHISNDMIQRQRHKRRRRPPYRDNFGRQVAALNGGEHGKTDEPIRTDGAQEDLVPLWVDDFLGCDVDGGCAVAVRGRGTC